MPDDVEAVIFCAFGVPFPSSTKKSIATVTARTIIALIEIYAEY